LQLVKSFNLIGHVVVLTGEIVEQLPGLIALCE